ncbi:MgtC/SapB family protein [Citreimonas salinaria]|uniref:Protein MgtC n=1 Tax=Citreimonas salinaria TaxID=321339 RepID=A0A1H3J3W0_9RHOB|nr:MgtC/SapB family protein [Citreimonas salinaria]SDY34683.1 putative Mg2+ transporter-C (MgtC) family protein [Citreimonas salinaria]
MGSLFNDFATDTSLDTLVILVRLLGAALVCGVIGFEREARARPAGLRTHMMVGLASCLYCLIMLETLADARDFTDRVAMDPIRVIEAVTSGVAFLAAGMIVFAKGKVQGLTTGTSLWLCAAIGLAIGFGMWVMAAMTAALALIIIRLVKTMEDSARKRFGRKTDEE